MKTKLVLLILCPMFLFSQKWNWVTNPTLNTSNFAKITINATCTNDYDDIFVTGEISSTSLDPIDFGNNVTLVNGTTAGHAYIAKYNSAGVAQWAQILGTQNGAVYSQGHSICADNKGNLYVTGDYNGTIQFSNGIPNISTLPGVGMDVFVIKCDKMGDVLWAKSANQTSGGGTNRGCGITFNPLTDECVITGVMEKETTFFSSSVNPISLVPNSGNTSMFIAKFDAGNGEIIWAKSPKSFNGFSLGNSVTTTDDGYAVTGMFNGDVDFALNTNKYECTQYPIYRNAKGAIKAVRC